MDLNQKTLVFYMKMEWSIFKQYAKLNLIMSPSGRQEHEVVGSNLVLDWEKNGYIGLERSKKETKL